MEKALEFKGILSSSEEYWTNTNVNENKNIQSDCNCCEEKNGSMSEIRNSITTNDSNLLNSNYSITQNSELDLNHLNKEDFSILKNEEIYNSSKLRNLTLSSNKMEKNEGNFYF